MAQPAAEPSLALIWAMAENGVIGKNNRLPWRLPNDMQFFMATTMAKPVIMGRKTFESMKAPLPGRTNIVVTGNADYAKGVAAGVVVADSFASAVAIGNECCQRDRLDEVMVAGGNAIYASGLELASRLYVTTVHAQVEGDTQFPELNWSTWTNTWERHYTADNRHAYSYTIAQWDRNG